MRVYERVTHTNTHTQTHTHTHKHTHAHTLHAHAHTHTHTHTQPTTLCTGLKDPLFRMISDSVPPYRSNPTPPPSLTNVIHE